MDSSRAAPGTSGPTLLWLLRCCWHVRVHSLIAAALLLARPGPLCCGCCAAAGTSGSTLLWLLRCCWHIRVRSAVPAALLLARPGPLYCACCWHVRVRVRVLVAAVGLLIVTAVRVSGSRWCHPGPTGGTSGSRLCCACPTGSRSGSAAAVTPRLAFKEFKRPEWVGSDGCMQEAVAVVTL